tara:strand:- start:76 stop:240 length:165 start_codon:yes stop_codon:yes gene_type:complete
MFKKIFNRLIEAREESARRKIARIQLEKMTDRELKDLGIGRFDIERAILYGKSI